MGENAAAEASQSGNTGRGGSFWFWWALWTIGLILLIARFAVEQKWDLFNDVISMKSLQDLDWRNWIEVALIVVGTLAGGAGAGAASSFVVKKANVIISGNRLWSPTKIKKIKKQGKFSEETLRKLEAGIDKLPTDLAKVMKVVLEEVQQSALPPQVSLPVESYEKMEALLAETLQNRKLRRRVRTLTRKRRDQAAQIQGYQMLLQAERDSLTASQASISAMQVRLDAKDAELDEAERLLDRARAVLDEVGGVSKRIEDEVAAISRKIAELRGATSKPNPEAA